MPELERRRVVDLGRVEVVVVEEEVGRESFGWRMREEREEMSVGMWLRERLLRSTTSEPFSIAFWIMRFASASWGSSERCVPASLGIRRSGSLAGGRMVLKLVFASSCSPSSSPSLQSSLHP